MATPGQRICGELIKKIVMSNNSHNVFGFFCLFTVHIDFKKVKLFKNVCFQDEYIVLFKILFFVFKKKHL